MLATYPKSASLWIAPIGALQTPISLRTVGISTTHITRIFITDLTHFVIRETAQTCSTTTDMLARSGIMPRLESPSGIGSILERMDKEANEAESFYSHRTPCGRRNHCDSLGHPPARPEQGQAEGLSSHLRQQPAPNLSCVQSLRRRLRRRLSVDPVLVRLPRKQGLSGWTRSFVRPG